MVRNAVAIIALFALTSSCITSKKIAGAEATALNELKLLDKYVIPHNLQYKGTTVGGLSSIDYNPQKDEYYCISDDRSNINPARFYTANVVIKNNKIDTVVFTNVHFMRTPLGDTFPDYNKNPRQSVDPESLRFNPNKNNFVWTSEGERMITNKDTVLVNPAIIIMDEQGKFIDTFRLPENLIMRANSFGPRQNGVLEGMSFGNKYKDLYVSVEEPLYEDGPKVETFVQKTWLRFFKFNVDTKKNIEQYAYMPEKIDTLPKPLSAFKVNGISEMLYIGNKQFLVVERAFSTGRQKCTIKIFLADASKAANIKDVPSLLLDAPAFPMTKKLLFNFDKVDEFIDNVEGITLGPVLPNGHQTIVLVVDNNFNQFEETQFILMEIIPS
ncbi:MAG: esterase-like activity of phytase family protein [Chitinophagaceae bacterium]|nr:esterase-like activity of phytase family protein [Chitinophagaceae bacterium]